LRGGKGKKRIGKNKKKIKGREEHHKILPEARRRGGKKPHE
jgi:hypothetical protein